MQSFKIKTSLFFNKHFVLCILSVIGYSALVLSSGLYRTTAQFIPFEDPTKSYILGSAVSLLFLTLTNAAFLDKSERNLLLYAWLLRSFICLVVILIYENYYQVIDAHVYYKNAHSGNFTLQTLFRYEGGNETVKKVISIFQIFFPPSYHLSQVCFSWLGFIGCIFFSYAARLFSSWPKKNIYALFLFFPSLLFWSSIIGKDVLSLFLISLFVLLTALWIKKDQFWFYILSAIPACLLYYVRPWLPGIFFLMHPIVFFLYYKKIRAVAFTSCVYFVLIFMAFFDTAQIEQQLNLTLRELNHLHFALSSGGSQFNVSVPMDTIGDWLVYLPAGIYDVLFRPTFLEVENVFGIISNLENIALLLALLMSFLNAGIKKKDMYFLVWSAGIIFVWSAVYYLPSSANLGTNARFKIQVLSLLLLIITMINNTKVKALKVETTV